MKSFEELDLVSRLQRALTELNYQHPTPIQAKSIPQALLGRDILGCAQTGTGKTAAFALPILNRLAMQKAKPVRNRPQALVLAPTRELIVQIGESLEAYGKHLSLKTALVYGGVSQNPQVRSLRQGVHVLAATPGRLIDLMQQGHIKLDRLQVFTLDEVDRMLDMGFLPDINRVIRELPDERQSLFFSATLPPEIQELTHRLLRDPHSVTVNPESPTVDKIKQSVFMVENKHKLGLLQDMLIRDEVEQAVVFMNTKRMANQTVEKLKRNGFQAVAVHGNKSQSARQNSLNAFQRGEYQVLVATDVAARGIDIQGISHVFNYSIPKEPESYVHRIGRTGRAGESGVAMSFCSHKERRELRAIEKLLGRRIHTVRNAPIPVTEEAEKEDAKKPAKPKPQGGSGRSRKTSAKAEESGNRKFQRRRGPKVNRNSDTSARRKKSRRRRRPENAKTLSS